MAENFFEPLSRLQRKLV